MRKRRIRLFVLFVMCLTGAAVVHSRPVPEEEVSHGTRAAVTSFYATHHRSDGNRIVGGSGSFPDITPVDIAVDGVPVWIGAVARDEGLIWAVVLDNGKTRAFRIAGGTATPFEIRPGTVPAEVSPLLVGTEDSVEFLIPASDSSPISPAALINARDTAYVDVEGNLVVERDGQATVLRINAQTDARVLVDDLGRLLVNTDPTDTYRHGIMGDRYEAGSVTLVSTDPEIRIIRTIAMPGRKVFEGIAPIWTDLDGDGAREIIVTLSDAETGAQLVVLDELGNIVSRGTPIGTGGRWRHQLAAGPFGPRGEVEIADVFTPHIGGPVEFFRWNGAELDLVAEVYGYTSHVIGSRNLDMAVAGRFDKTGKLTILLPTYNRQRVGAIQRVEGGAEVAWELPLGGKLVSNIAAIQTVSGEIALGVGLDNGYLRIWQPQVL